MRVQQLIALGFRETRAGYVNDKYSFLHHQIDEATEVQWDEFIQTVKNDMPTLAFNFEIYTCNPETGETGWDIHCPTVFAKDKAEAKEKLKSYPNYDCIILFNCGRPMNETDTEYYANGYDFYLP